MHPSDQIIINEFREKFKKEWETSDCDTGWEDYEDFLLSALTRVRDEAIKQGQKEAIEFISDEEGWENSREHFLKHFGIK